MQIHLIDIDQMQEGPYFLNMFFDPGGSALTGRPAVIGRPGLKEFCDTGKYGECRGSHVMGNNLYVVVRDTLYRVSQAGEATAISGTLRTRSGPVWMADCGTYLVIVDGEHGYYYSGTRLSRIGDVDFTGATSLTFQDGYFIVTEPQSGRFWMSELYDPTSWDALDYVTAEWMPDDVKACISISRLLWMFGDYTTEIYRNVGDPSIFKRALDLPLEIGLGAASSITMLDNTAKWLDQYYRVIRANQFIPQVISTRTIDREIGGYSKQDDAIGFGITIAGHAFYVLNFPTADRTWVYDAATGLWARWSSGTFKADGTRGRFWGNCYSYFDGKHLVGDYRDGKIYELDWDTYEDDGTELARTWYSQPIFNDRQRVPHNSFEMELEAGVGLVVDDTAPAAGEDPQAVMQYSDDRGRTWSNEKWADMGKIGEYSTRAKWRRLGRSYHRQYRVTVTDPVKAVMLQPYLNAPTRRAA